MISNTQSQADGLKNNPRYYERTEELPIKLAPITDGKINSKVQPINVSEPKTKESHSRSISSKTEMRPTPESVSIFKKDGPEPNEEILMELRLKGKTK
jgi:hypothetical protein